jgi:diguanylate cyclase (GGDEF)-like protein
MSENQMPLHPDEKGTGRQEISKETILEFEKRNTRVLVADDDDSIRSLITNLLDAENIPATACASGQEALEWVKKEDFGIIITDIKLRDFDGMGLLKASKVINPETDVIIVTGYPTVETAVTAMRYGAAEYFTKPFGVDKLRRAINRLIEKRILERKLKVERHQLEIQRYDVETGLFSNRYFHALLSHEITRANRFTRSLGLLLAQVSGLKGTQGPEFNNSAADGDHLMKSLARLLRSCCRQTDFIARYSFDEFAMILTETTDEGIDVVAQRITDKLQALTAEFSPQIPGLLLAACFGVASYPESGSSKEALLSKANEKLMEHRQ